MAMARPGAGSGTVTATYDSESNLLSSTYPGGRKIGYSYDILDRIQAITDDTDAQPGPMIADYKYVGRYRVAERAYGNNTSMTYAYDGGGATAPANPANDFGVRQVIGTTHTFYPDELSPVIFEDRIYRWDRMNNKTMRKDVRPGGPRRQHDFTYDAAYRLTDTTVWALVGGSPIVRQTSYTLDGVHNRLSTSGTVNGNPDPAVGIYTMNDDDCTDLAMNKYTTTPLDQRSYDANGNLTRILGNDASGNALAISCLYDYRNRMVEYLDSETLQRHTYAYDALGRRIVKTVDADGVADGPTTTRYFYGGESQWQVCEEQIPDTEPPFTSDATIATYVYGRYIDEVIQMQRCEDGAFPPCNGVSPVDYYYHTDDMYNVMAATDENGSVVERYEYGDYGTPTFMDAAGNALTLSDGTPLTSSAIANPYLFTGRRHDPESGWYNYRTRYLDPQSGKFTTRDVIGIWGDSGAHGNGYTYVENNPSSWLDPIGLAARKSLKDRFREVCKKECKARCKQSVAGPNPNDPAEGCTSTVDKPCFDNCTNDCNKEVDKIIKRIKQEIDRCNARGRAANCTIWSRRLRWLLNQLDLEYFVFDAIKLVRMNLKSAHAVLGITGKSLVKGVIIRNSPKHSDNGFYYVWEFLIDPTNWNRNNLGGEEHTLEGGTGEIQGQGRTHGESRFLPLGPSQPELPGEHNEDGPRPDRFPP